MSSPVMLSLRSFARLFFVAYELIVRVSADAKAREVRAAFVRVDVVREGVDRLRVAVVPLQRDLGVDAVLLAAHVDRLLVDRRLVLVQVLHERDDAAFVVELVALAVALVVERDDDAAVQERQLAQPLRQRVEAEIGGFEDLRVRLERDLGAAPLRRAGDLEIGRLACHARRSADRPVRCARSRVERFGQRVDDRHADAVQTARDLVAVVVELAAGVQHRQHDFGGRLAACRAGRPECRGRCRRP